MKINYKLSNVCGTVYRYGNVVFSPNGNIIYSPVGNRIASYDLVNNTSYTFPIENRHNIQCIALSPTGQLLLSVDCQGHSILINVPRRSVLHHFNFKDTVRAAAFSPDGRHLVAAVGSQVQVWLTPSVEKTFTPFVKVRTYTGHFDQVTHLQWSPDGRWIISCGKDNLAKIWSLEPVHLGDGHVKSTNGDDNLVEAHIGPDDELESEPAPGTLSHDHDSAPVAARFRGRTLAGHRSAVVGAYWTTEQDTVYTVSRDGALFTWQPKEDAEEVDDDQRPSSVDRRHPDWVAHQRWGVAGRFYFLQPDAHVTCSTYHAPSSLLVVGFSNGTFGLWECRGTSIENIHSLSIGQEKVTSVAINPSGEWLAFGAAKLGQLLVWEWQSESYILKQQGHFYDMNTATYSNDAQHLVTGGDDGKIKVWSTASGFCFVTFTEHQGPISAIEYAKHGQLLFSASLDGTVRAFDLLRYRNFKTFTSPSPVQFSSLAVDPNGDVVCVGSQDTFEIFVWSIQTGKLLDVLAGHEGPVCALAFSPTSDLLASGSWDKTVRIWNIFGRTKETEPLRVDSDCLAIAFRPDGHQLAVSTLNGQIIIWDVLSATQSQVIEGRRDLSGGRKSGDAMTAANSSANKYFTTITYSADGTCLLAAGNSKHICMYEVAGGALLKKFVVSENRSIQGTQDILNSKNLTEAGPLDLIDNDGDLEDLKDRLASARRLPGAQRGDLSLRNYQPEIRIRSLTFAPTGRSFAAASTEGLLVYSLDDGIYFDPFDIDINITPDTIKASVHKREFLKALVMALRLNEYHITKETYESISAGDITLISRGLPPAYLEQFLLFLGRHLETSRHVEFDLQWCKAIFANQGRYLKTHYRSAQMPSALRTIQKSMMEHQKSIGRLCEENISNLDYLILQNKRRNAP